MPNFVLRLLTAALMIPAFAYAMFRENPVYFCALIPPVSLLAAHELFAMLGRRGYRPFSVVGYVLVLAVQAAAYLDARGLIFEAWSPVLALVVAAVVISMLLAQLLRGHRETNFLDVCVTLFGVFYVGWLASFFIRLRVMPDGARWVFFLMLATWIFDSTACSWGVNFGRRKLWAVVSPKKTWEGFIGGLVSTLAIVWGVTVMPDYFPALPGLFPAGVSPVFLLFLTPVICVAAQVGDLVESMIKRTVEIKDSSAILPGHGGFLDKLDSFFFTAPLVYVAALAAGYPIAG